MAAARGFFDQYSVFCVFGSVVGCVVVPLITQSFESLIFSAIVITLTANRLSKRILANEQKSGHQRDAVERRRAVSQAGSGPGKKKKKVGSPSQAANFGYEELRKRREEELRREEESKRREMEQREEDRREKKARKKMERKERREQERINREREEEEKQKRHEARLLQRRGKAASENEIETISSWRDQPVQRASSTSSIASSSSSNCSNPAPRHALRPQSPPIQYQRKNRRCAPVQSRPWYLPSRPVLKPCSISYDASRPSRTAPPPPPPPPTNPENNTTWVSSPSLQKRKLNTSTPETISALKIDTVESRITTEDLPKTSLYDSPFTEPLPPYNASNLLGLNNSEFSGEFSAGGLITGDPGPRLLSLFGRETKSPMFGQLVGSENK